MKTAFRLPHVLAGCLAVWPLIAEGHPGARLPRCRYRSREFRRS